MFDVIVVGGGPAGLSAALMLGRCRRKVLVCDSFHYRNAHSHGLHGYLSRDGIPPLELLEIGRQELKQYVTVEMKQTEVTDARRSGDHFEVTLTGGNTIQCRKLLLATGVEDNLPPIPYVENYFGRSVFHCPYCDGWEVKDKHVAVFGNGKSVHALALELTAWTRLLTICTGDPPDFDEEQKDDLRFIGARIRPEKIRGLQGEDGYLEKIVFEEGPELQCDALFFTLGQKQSSHLPAKLGCEFTDKGAVKTGTYEVTCVEGLYVAGDASQDVQFVAVAAAEGVQAAFAINKALLKEDLAALRKP